MVLEPDMGILINVSGSLAHIDVRDISSKSTEKHAFAAK